MRLEPAVGGDEAVDVVAGDRKEGRKDGRNYDSILWDRGRCVDDDGWVVCVCGGGRWSESMGCEPRQIEFDKSGLTACGTKRVIVDRPLIEATPNESCPR
jgi:hypothetical protein